MSDETQIDVEPEAVADPDPPGTEPAQEPEPEQPDEDEGDGAEEPMDAADPIAALAVEMRRGFTKIGEILGAQNARLERLEITSPPPVVKDKKDGALPEGTVRFYSPNRELRLTLRPRMDTVVDGRLVTTHGKAVLFQDGIFDTRDKKQIEQLRAHASYGKRFFEDPDAKPIQRVQVHAGPKTSRPEPTRERREALAAPLN